MLFTWDFEKTSLYNCVNLACYPSPTDSEEVQFAVCNKKSGLVEKFVTYKVTIVNTDRENRIKLEETGSFAAFMRLLRIGNPMERAIEQKFNRTLRETPDYLSRPTEHTRKLNNFRLLQKYQVKPDGACFFRCFLAKYYKNPYWLTRGSSQDILNALLTCNAKPHILNAINTSFTAAINHVHQLPDDVKDYFAQHPDFAETIFNATIGKANFRLFLPSFVKRCLVGLPRATTYGEQYAINQFFHHFVNGIFEACQEGLDFHTNSTAPERHIQHGEPIALCVIDRNHYELLASPEFFERGYQPKTLAATKTSSVTMTKACPESLLRCVLAYHHKNREWTSLVAKKQQEVADEFANLGFKESWKQAMLSTVRRRIQNQQFNQQNSLPEYFQYIDFEDDAMLEKIYDTLFLETELSSKQLWRLQHLLRVEGALQKEASTFAALGGDGSEWVQRQVHLKSNEGFKTGEWEHLQLRDIEKDGDNPFPIVRTHFERDILFSILEEATQSFLRNSHIACSPEEGELLAFVNGHNGSYYVCAPDDFFPDEFIPDDSRKPEVTTVKDRPISNAVNESNPSSDTSTQVHSPDTKPW